MIDVSTKFELESKKWGITSNTWEKVYLTKQDGDSKRIEITNFLIENGIEIITKEVEQGLHTFKCSDVTLTCMNTPIGGSEVVPGPGPAGQMEVELPKEQEVWKVRIAEGITSWENQREYFFNYGEGYFDDLSDRIRCEIYVGFDNCDDEIKIFDGFIIPETVKRLNKNEFEFTCRSWEKYLEEFDAQLIADNTNSPIKNITNLSLESEVWGGITGVYTLKYFFDKITGKRQVQYDDGEKVHLTQKNHQYMVSNKYPSDNPRHQTIRVTTPSNLDDLLEEDEEDTIVVLRNEGGTLVAGYWYENIHLKKLVSYLFDKAGITTQDIDVKDIPQTTGEKAFRTYNTFTESNDMKGCVYLGNNLFVFVTQKSVYRIKKTETEELDYEELQHMGSEDLHNIFYREGYCWIIREDSGTFKLWKVEITEDSFTSISQTTLTGLVDGKHCTIHPKENKIYWAYNSGGLVKYRYIELGNLQISNEVNTGIGTTLCSESRVISSGNSLYFWGETGSYYYFRRYDFVNDNKYEITYTTTNQDFHIMGYSVTYGMLFATYRGIADNILVCYTQSSDSATYHTIPDSARFVTMLNSPYLYDTDPVLGFLDTDHQFIMCTGAGDTGYSILASGSDGLQQTPTDGFVIFNFDNIRLFGIAKVDSSNLIGWQWSNLISPYVKKANFKDFTIRDALNDLAKNFLCTWELIAKDSGRFRFREFNLGSFKMPKSLYQQDSDIFMWWEHYYDGIKIMGINDMIFEKGQKTFDAKILSIDSRYIDDSTGDMIANWFLNFFNIPRKMYKITGVFLPHLELLDLVKLTDEYEDTIEKTIVYKIEYLSTEKAFRFHLLQCFIPDEFDSDEIKSAPFEGDAIDEIMKTRIDKFRIDWDKIIKMT